MFSKSDVSTRRILKFPAVRPCEAVSPVTLLDSLIDLASRICKHKSVFFGSNNRNARESIRLVGVLSNFFDEIRETQLGLSDHVVLSFSELHFVFQKLQFLLEDCAREGSRLWMLMKCERVASHFRFLMKAIAAALDVLPLREIDVSVESRDSVQLAVKQLRRSSFEVDPVDRFASNEVLSILSQFECYVVPETNDPRRVLDNLGIKVWSDCNKEIKFLESEMGIDYLSLEKRDLGVMSSLIGFLTYARCVLFTAVDGGATNQSSGGCNGGDVVRYLNPDDFRCPISLELMVDPVTIHSGHTYDRSSILKWFKSGNHTCPLTGEKLRSADLIPNLALKRVISVHCSENGVPVVEKGAKNRDITRTILAGSAAAEASASMVADYLARKLISGTENERSKAAYEVRLLTKSSIFNRSCLAEAGMIPNLLALLYSNNPLAQENAIAAVLNLSKHSKSKTIIVENGGVQSILFVLKEGLKVEARQHAAGALFYLASVEEYCVLIGETPGAISALMDLLRDGTDRGKKNSLVAIFGLLMHPSNQFRVLQAGLVPLLATLLMIFEREDLVTDSLAVLASLAEGRDGANAVLRAGFLPLIVEVLNSSTSKAGKEYCVSLLLALCVNGGGDVVRVLVKNPSLMGSLYALLTDGNSRAMKKASSLIRLLHEFQERTSSRSSVSPAFPSGQFVHAW